MGISVLIAERNDFLREKIAGRISRHKNVRVVSQISDCQNIVQTAMECAPDVVIADLRQIVMNSGIIAELRDICPNSSVFVIADCATGQYLETANMLGADGIIDKYIVDADLEALLLFKTTSRQVCESSENLMPAQTVTAGRVIVADDDAFFRQRIQAFLDTAGIKHRVLASGAAVIKELINKPTDFNCVLLDVHMGGINGLATARVVRHYMHDIPIILMTCDDDPLIDSDVVSISNAVLLRKPFKEAILINMIRKAILRKGTQRKSIIVVEDDPDVREFLKEIIISNDFAYIEAQCGREAVEKITNLKPDMVLLDIILPDMRGWTVYDSVAGLIERDRIPVIFFSGSAEAEEEYNLYKRPNTYFIAKPFDINNIEDIINSMLCDFAAHGTPPDSFAATQ